MDWTSSMQQTFEYCEVDPNTWKDARRLDMFSSCKIDWDAETDTLGSASYEVYDYLDECYVRAYMIAIQNGVKNKIPLGTFLVQSPSDNFDGKRHKYSIEGYTPLIELKESSPPLGYSIPKDSDILAEAYLVTKNHVRAPVVKPTGSDKLVGDFISNIGDTWFTFNHDLLANASFSYDLDEMGRILFAPNQDTASLAPVWTYDDGNSSILYPDISIEADIYNVPNVVEVLYSVNSGYLYSKAVNNDPNSPTSTVSRGREIVYRVTDPDLYGVANQPQIDAYAEQVLRNMSSLKYRVSYSHGYNGVRVNDCVRLNYERAGLYGVKAKVISQSITCDTGCVVSETAIFTKKLWR